MSTPELNPSSSEITIEEYVALLKKAADHLIRIANDPRVNDPTFVSEPVQHIIDTPVEDLANELKDGTKEAADEDESLFWPQVPYY